MDNTYDNPAKIVTRCFIKSGLTQKDFAEKCNISVSSLRSYLQGKVQPRPSTMEKIERVFGGQVEMQF